MASDYIQLTDEEGNKLRVVYDSIEVIKPQSHMLPKSPDSHYTYVHEGSTIFMSSGARFWVRECPQYIDATIEAVYEEHRIDYDPDDDDLYE